MERVRFYRSWYNKKYSNFNVKYKETDLSIRVPSDHNVTCLKECCYKRVKKLRKKIDKYIEENPCFKDSLKPIRISDDAPAEVQEIAAAAQIGGVGPMAAIAGLFAEYIGRFLMDLTGEVIVENGGDIFLSLIRDGIVGVYAGDSSPFTHRLAIKVPGDRTPLGICTSAGTVGPSLSLGKADAVIVLSPSAVLADAVATSLGNRIKKEEDIEHVLEESRKIKNVTGVMIMKNDKIGVRGEIELVKV